jgi:T4 RnlA family RNA ligase
MYLEVQDYLLSGKTLEDLQLDFGVKANHHIDGRRVILNYDQFNSPRKHPIARECRGLILDKKDWSVVARSFKRFFNLGEFPEEEAEFNWSDFTVTEKCDGSLATLYYWNNEWHLSTKNSYSNGEVNNSGYTWLDIFKQAIPNLDDLQNFRLRIGYSYVWELTSPHNKVVRYYPEPKAFLLTVVDNESGKEASQDSVFEEALYLGVDTPEAYDLKSLSDISMYLEDRSVQDATFEGVVLRDKSNLRFKLKTPKYLALHRLKGETGNLFHPKHLIPFILNGECEELLCYFKECKPYLDRYSAIITEAQSEVMDLWNRTSSIEDQKTFALSVKDHKLSAILFQARKKSCTPMDIWNESGDYLLKVLFTKDTYCESL